MTAQLLIDGVIGREGGYSNHPADRGGPTRWGITEQVARSYGYKGDMQALPRDTAVTIYTTRYWERPGFYLVGARYPKVAEELLDTGINMGPVIAGQFLQRALNLLNQGAVDYPDVGEDGDVGPMTLHALDAFKAKRGAAGEKVLLATLNGFQVCRYAEITKARPANESFFYGWIANRIGALA